MMRRWAVLICLLLGACQPKTSDVNVTISGVTIQDIEGIKKELSAIAGVSDIRMGALKEGCVTLVVASTKKGGDLASTLAASASGLKNVKGFDDGAITIAYSAAVVPVAAVTPLAQPTQPTQPIQPIQPFQPQPQPSLPPPRPQPQPQTSPAKRIPGGSPQTFQEMGISFDIPSGWQAQSAQGGMMFIPGDGQKSEDGQPLELFSLSADPDLKSLDGQDLERSTQKLLQEIQGFKATQAQTPFFQDFGEFKGVFRRFKGTHPAGYPVEIRCFSVIGPQGACTLYALGYSELMDKRSSEVYAIVQSMRRAGAAPGTPGGPGN